VDDSGNPVGGHAASASQAVSNRSADIS